MRILEKKVVEMTTNMWRLLSSAIAKSEFSGGRRLICSTAQLFQNELPGKDSPIIKDGEKIHKLIEDEAKKVSESESSDDESVNKLTGEIGGPRGPEPTRYGDWEKNGRCSDF